MQSRTAGGVQCLHDKGAGSLAKEEFKDLPITQILVYSWIVKGSCHFGEKCSFQAGGVQVWLRTIILAQSLFWAGPSTC